MNNKPLGIMGSYPELMRAAQGYQTGGNVVGRRPLPFEDPTVMGRPIRPSSLGVPPLAGMPPSVNRDVSLGLDARNSPALRRQILAASAPSFGGSTTLGDLSRAEAEDAILSLLETTGSSARLGSRGGAPDYSEDDVASVSRGRRPPKLKTKEDLLAEAENLREQASKITPVGQGNRPGSADVARQNLLAKADDLEQQAAMAPSGASSAVDMTTPMGGPRRGGRTQSVVDDMTTPMGGPRRGGRTQSVVDDMTTPAPDETLPPMITNDPEGTASEALSSLDKSYEEKLALFQKVFGDGDEDTSRDRAMSLAMIGLAIAAGQSPNALTNIAQGAMVGLQAMGAKEQARKEKREKTKLLALDAALKEHAAQQEFVRALDLEAIKAGNKSQYRDIPQVRDLGGFGNVEVYLPIPGAVGKGVAPILADPKDFDAIYKQSLEGRQKVFGMVDQAESLIEQYDIAGFDGALARLKQDFGAAIPGVLKEAFGFDGGSGEPTPQQQYDTIMRAMAAQFTPIILGESGRTISDGDRQRVADILGFAVDSTTGKIGQYEGTAFTSESELKSALRQVRSILGSNYSDMDRIYSRYRPEQYRKLQENNQKQEPKNRLRFDINGNPVE